MKNASPRTFIPLIILCAIVGAASPSIAQDNYAFHIARIKYGGGGDWYGDETSLVQLLKFAKEHTLLDVAPEEDVVELTSDKLYSYPYVYLTGHGNVVFS
ncbi:MAG: DUF4159 domain-containing protein, partial [Rhodothermales bacterium]